MLTTIYRQEDGTVASLHLHAENDGEKRALAQAAEHFSLNNECDEVLESDPLVDDNTSIELQKDETSAAPNPLVDETSAENDLVS